MIDFQATLYDPIYDSIGVKAYLIVAPGEPRVGIIVIDKTAGVVVNENGGPEMQTIRPAADVRMVELTATELCKNDLDEGLIEFNGKTWRIGATLLRPSPNGLLDGELRLLLTEES